MCALISKSAGGIGLAAHCIRSTGSYIAGVSGGGRGGGRGLQCLVPIPQTNGTSNGLIPMLRVYNNTARYVDQGGNKVESYISDLPQWCALLYERLMYSFSLSAETWGICSVPGALASRHHRFPGPQEKPRSRGKCKHFTSLMNTGIKLLPVIYFSLSSSEGEGSVLCSLDPRPVHEAGGE